MTSAGWAKLRGQEELRENLRSAMRESGRSQRDISEAAGVSLSHVTSGLRHDCWLRRDAVAAIAAELEVPLDEMVGGSIFKEERARYAEFPEPREVREQQRAAMTASEDRNRALCCVSAGRCG